MAKNNADTLSDTKFHNCTPKRDDERPVLSYGSCPPPRTLIKFKFSRKLSHVRHLLPPPPPQRKLVLVLFLLVWARAQAFTEWVSWPPISSLSVSIDCEWSLIFDAPPRDAYPCGKLFARASVYFARIDKSRVNSLCSERKLVITSFGQAGFNIALK